jgi:hypothetical protein
LGANFGRWFQNAGLQRLSSYGASAVTPCNGARNIAPSGAQSLRELYALAHK